MRTDNDLVEEGEGERCAVSIVSHEFHVCDMCVSFLILVHAAFKGSLFSSIDVDVFTFSLQSIEITLNEKKIHL